jgi:phage shock protein C
MIIAYLESLSYHKSNDLATVGDCATISICHRQMEQRNQIRGALHQDAERSNIMDPRLTRSRTDRMIGGVAGGIARYFNIDPVIVRLVMVLSVFAGGVTPLIYLVLWAIMPEEQPSSIPTVSKAAAAMLPEHPRPVEQWKYDPYTGEKIKQ